MQKKVIGALLILLMSQPVMAAMPINDDEEVVRAANEGIQLFQQGKYSEAASSFDYASQLARQKRGGDLKNFLPKPLPGWGMEQEESQALGSGMFGGMTSATGRYTKGTGSIEVTIVADSPMLQAALMMLSNPMFAVADGGRIQTINGQKAIVKFDSETGEGEAKIVAGQVLVTLQGSQIVFEDLISYAQAIPYTELQA